jgi:hypothetical protein
MYGRYRKFIQTFGLIFERENQLQDFGIDERLIFKRDVEETGC